MADVDMTDAPVEKKKVTKGGDADGKGEKKRFEVKKVGRFGTTVHARLC
jgi:hypothetical protein